MPSSTPDAILINGKGRFVNGPKEDLAVISVKQNTKYRLVTHQEVMSMADRESHLGSD